MTAHRYLLTELLRGEWGFDGFVVSDWSSIPEVVLHGVAEDTADAAKLCLHSGVDMDMVGFAFINHLEQLVKNGDVPISEIDEAVRRILRIKLRAGLFENPYTDPHRAGHDILRPEYRQLSRTMAINSAVLLKNQGGILPLSNHFKRITIAGPLVHAKEELFGCWTPDGRPEDVISLSQTLLENCPEGVELSIIEHTDRILDGTFRSDAIVLIAGEHPNRSGENNNVSDLGLPVGQRELILSVSRMGKPVILVVLAGRGLAIPDEVAAVNAVLFVFHPGIEGGMAISELLFGKQEPGGRLPISLPRSTGQMPLYYNHKNSGRPVGEGMFSRRYVDLANGPLFPFGFGLSYTQFSYKNLVLSSSEMQESLEISAEVTNTGKIAGSEIAQLYIRDLVGQVTRPVKELKGFQKIHLQPGQTRKVYFQLKREDLAYFGVDEQLHIEPGNYYVWIGPNSSQGLRGEFRLL
jgi:beta-glucosidase